MSFLSVKNVYKSYGDNLVLERLNLNVERGEFISMVGASGCGKSTFLNMLLGKEALSKGEIFLEGKSLSQEPDAERGIVFQKYSVFPHLTVLQNIMIADEFSQAPLLGWTFGATKKNIKQKALDFISIVGLTAAINKYPNELSGGMQQRLAIAQALMKSPKILLLDEPFGALDPGIRADMHELIHDIWQQNNLTIFMVTHDIKEGFELGSRLWVFDKLRHDPQAPNAYGAQVTFDLPLTTQKHKKIAQETLEESSQNV
ncbi:ABC transporter ATP-binding protein [Shewanella saliphila]|uniref:ABC transporter ATP-binding protein n=1 Tax=Shewanella saliphila TaxID=2282698 RepID=A0ABQ2QD58_9GAMM|nr:ABC transporter ATP-binding protein [Shewanella saliphila]MCL1103370.1 ABC transporter ATP-binding protein [Shewanella saliphila]GGP68964.1 ABC transporter ATP-binding protein [Shewanella saliphila]